MSRSIRYDICAATLSDLPFDARVWKESRSLAAAGYSLALIGCRYEIDEVSARRDGSIAVREVPFGSRERSASPVDRLRVLLRLWWETLRTPASIYHSHNVEVAPAAWLASRLRRARLVYDAHELYAEATAPSIKGRIEGAINALIERFMLARSDAVITTNQARAEVLQRAYSRDDIEIVGNVPTRRDEVVAFDPGYPAGHPVLLYQGHISADGRAFRETLEALTEFEDLHFAIIGFARKSRIDLIREWARELGIEDRVHLMPPRPFDELVGTAAAATVGLVPIYANSLNNYLGDTNKLFEYLMAGLPVVASDFPEIRRVASQGDPPVGEVFDPESPESIAEALHRVLDNPRVYERRRAEARRLALERFNWEIEERRLVSLYGRVANGAHLTDGAGA